MEKTTLQCWERIKGIRSTYEMGAHYNLGDDPYYRDEVVSIEKSLKALDIISKKNVNIYFLKITNNYIDYNKLFISLSHLKLTLGEFILLKEVLKWI